MTLMNKCYSQGSLVCKPGLYFANEYVGERVIARGSATSHPAAKKTSQPLWQPKHLFLGFCAAFDP